VVSFQQASVLGIRWSSAEYTAFLSAWHVNLVSGVPETVTANCAHRLAGSRHLALRVALGLERNPIHEFPGLSTVNCSRWRRCNSFIADVEASIDIACVVGPLSGVQRE
jgi:hypothetical protein